MTPTAIAPSRYTPTITQSIVEKSVEKISMTGRYRRRSGGQGARCKVQGIAHEETNSVPLILTGISGVTYRFKV